MPASAERPSRNCRSWRGARQRCVPRSAARRLRLHADLGSAGGNRRWHLAARRGRWCRRMPNELTPAMGRWSPLATARALSCDAQRAACPRRSRGCGSCSGGWAGIADGCSDSATLIRPATPAAPSGVADVGLDRADQARCRPARRPSASTAPSAFDLDRVAGARAGAVRFDVARPTPGDTPARRYACRSIVLLATARRRRQESAGAAVVVDRAAANHRVDRIAVGQRLRQAA